MHNLLFITLYKQYHEWQKHLEISTNTIFKNIELPTILYVITYIINVKTSIKELILILKT